MLFANQHELQKNIALLIDQALDQEVSIRDYEIKKLKEDLVIFKKQAKDNEMNERTLKKYLSIINAQREILEKIESGEIKSINFFEDWESFSDGMWWCGWYHVLWYKCIKKDWVEEVLEVDSESF